MHYRQSAWFCLGLVAARKIQTRRSPRNVQIRLRVSRNRSHLSAFSPPETWDSWNKSNHVDEKARPRRVNAYPVRYTRIPSRSHSRVLPEIDLRNGRQSWNALEIRDLLPRFVCASDALGFSCVRYRIMARLNGLDEMQYIVVLSGFRFTISSWKVCECNSQVNVPWEWFRCDSYYFTGFFFFFLYRFDVVRKMFVSTWIDPIRLTTIHLSRLSFHLLSIPNVSSRRPSSRTAFLKDPFTYRVCIIGKPQGIQNSTFDLVHRFSSLTSSTFPKAASLAHPTIHKLLSGIQEDQQKRGQ